MENYVKSVLWQDSPSVTVDCTWWDIRCFSSCLKKWTFLDLVCSVDLVTITTGLIHSDRSCLKKRHFLDLLCSVHVITITTGLNYCNRSCFLKWHYLDLVCSGHVVTITTDIIYSNRSRLKKWHFPDLICAVKIRKKGMFWTQYVQYIW